MSRSPLFSSTASRSLSIVVVGGGIAGATAAVYLSLAGARVSVYAGAGQVATEAGIANPFTARKGNPAWRYAEALVAFDALAQTIGVDAQRGVLRPARDLKQARAFAAVAGAHPAWASWLEGDEAARRFPAVAVPRGALWIPRGRSLSFSSLLSSLHQTARLQGATVVPQTVEAVSGSGRVRVHLVSGEVGLFDYALLCVGGGFGRFPLLHGYGLHRIKGQTVRLERPPALPDLPAVSGGGYVLTRPESVLVGASYEHDFADLAPSDAVTEELRRKAERLVPALSGAPLLGASAGVRVTRPGRMPLLGPVRADGRVWAFTALGSKGLLSAPLLARALPAYLTDPALLPAAVRPSQTSGGT